MVALDIVHASNARLKELGPGLVALFVGATSGIGEFTMKAFVQNTLSPRVYIVGRNREAADRIIAECGGLNKEAKVEFLPADVSELAEVDRVCRAIAEKEQRVNLLVQSQGNLNFRGRDESPEGLARKLSLNYYSRMRFITNLLPLFDHASTTAPHFSRSLSILGSGTGGALNFDDLDLKQSFSAAKCAAHSCTMNDLIVAELAKKAPGTTFVHSYPRVVRTGAARELPAWARIGAHALLVVLAPFMVSAEETGARQLFMATSGIYPPAKPFPGDGTRTAASGVSRPSGMDVAEGAGGQAGDGGYNLSWNCAVNSPSKTLASYRRDSVPKQIWDHTSKIFEDVEKVNKQRLSTT